MKNNYKKSIFAFVKRNYLYRFAIAGAFFIFFVFNSFGQEADRGYIANVGDSVPDINFRFADGTNASLYSMKAKVVVLQFTASWCSVCRKEMPHLETEVWLHFKDKGLILIGVDLDEPLEKVISFKTQMKITYPMALDPGGEIFQLFARKGAGVTRNVVIDMETKRIIFLTRLYNTDEFNKMVEKIEESL